MRQVREWHKSHFEQLQIVPQHEGFADQQHIDGMEALYVSETLHSFLLKNIPFFPVTCHNGALTFRIRLKASSGSHTTRRPTNGFNCTHTQPHCTLLPMSQPTFLKALRWLHASCLHSTSLVQRWCKQSTKKQETHRPWEVAAS